MDERTRFLDAVRGGAVETVRTMLGTTPELASSTGEDGVTAILAALYNRRQAVLDVLLAAGPDLTLFEAAALGEVDRLRALLSVRGSRAGEYAVDGFTPLHLAAYFGREEAVQVLLEAGAPVDATTRNAMANRPLHAAAAGRHDGVVRLLVEAGADANARQAGGWTALHAAAQHGDDDLVEMLLEAGAHPELVADDGRSAADLAEAGGRAQLASRLRGLE
ncbi:MAG: ankyrin repeat domain-containing protein [Gemmatimonadota bacterium]